jgi:hypothetical protein
VCVGGGVGGFVCQCVYMCIFIYISFNYDTFCLLNFLSSVFFVMSGFLRNSINFVQQS